MGAGRKIVDRALILAEKMKIALGLPLVCARGRPHNSRSGDRRYHFRCGIESLLHGSPYPPAFFSILAQESFSGSVRLKIFFVSDESGSRQK